MFLYFSLTFNCHEIGSKTCRRTSDIAVLGTYIDNYTYSIVYRKKIVPNEKF
jgi:hypothetical protein